MAIPKNRDSGIYIKSLLDYLDKQPDTSKEQRFEEIVENLKKDKKAAQSQWEKAMSFFFESLFPGLPWLPSEIYGEPILSAHQERMLVENYKATNDVDIRNLVICCYLKFVIRIVKNYSRPDLDSECLVDFDDLFQEGVLGLIIAIERFELKEGYRFGTYAWWWVLQRVLTALENNRTIKIPSNRFTLFNSISQVSDELWQSNETEPEPETVAKKLGVSVNMVQDTLMLARDVWSLDASLDASFHEFDNHNHNLLHRLPDQMQKAPDEVIVEDSVRKQVKNVLESLDVREAEVLSLYFGFDNDEQLTLEEIGVRLKLTRERVRQIKEKALGRLRHPSRRSQLKPLLEVA